MTAPEGQSRPTTSETIDVLNNRRSIRKYLSEPVGKSQLDAILEAACRAPTSSNIQGYSIVQVRDPATKEKLAAACGNQEHVAACPVFLAFCADLTRVEEAFRRHGHSLDDNNMEMGLVATIDATLAGMAAYVAADSLGIQGVMIGGIRNKPETIADILKLPRRVYAVFGMCLGYPAGQPKQKPRMPKSGIVHEEAYDPAAALEAIDIYDGELKEHYMSIGKETTDQSWSNEIDTKFSKRPRDFLRDALKARGFDFS